MLCVLNGPFNKQLLSDVLEYISDYNKDNRGDPCLIKVFLDFNKYPSEIGLITKILKDCNEHTGDAKSRFFSIFTKLNIKSSGDFALMQTAYLSNMEFILLGARRFLPNKIAYDDFLEKFSSMLCSKCGDVLGSVENGWVLTNRKRSVVSNFKKSMLEFLKKEVALAKARQESASNDAAKVQQDGGATDDLEEWKDNWKKEFSPLTVKILGIVDAYAGGNWKKELINMAIITKGDDMYDDCFFSGLSDNSELRNQGRLGVAPHALAIRHIFVLANRLIPKKVC